MLFGIQVWVYNVMFVDYLTWLFCFLWYWKQKKKLFNSLLDWQSLRYHDGIISVGSVNWKNIATIFSSYAKDNYGFISIYFCLWNDLKNDRDELSKNNYYMYYDRFEKIHKNYQMTREFKNKISYLFDFRGPVICTNDNRTYITSSK